jgi:hypothetical protein
MLGKPRSRDSVSWAAFLPIPLLTAPGPLWHALRRASRLRHLDPQDEPVIRIGQIPRPVRADHAGPDVLSHPVWARSSSVRSPLRRTRVSRRQAVVQVLPDRAAVAGDRGVVAPVLGLDLLQLRRRRPPPALRCRPRRGGSQRRRPGTGRAPRRRGELRPARRPDRGGRDSRAGGDLRGRQGVRGAHRPRRAIRRPVHIGSQPRSGRSE